MIHMLVWVGRKLHYIHEFLQSMSIKIIQINLSTQTFKLLKLPPSVSHHIDAGEKGFSNVLRSSLANVQRK